MYIFNVVYITDENYLMPTCVSIVSLKITRHKNSNFHVYVLTEKISEDGYKKLISISEDNFKIDVLKAKIDEYEKLAKNCITNDTPVTRSALYKFDIANILGDLDKVLYLDGDILVNKDISELFDIDLSDKYVAAVDEMGDTYLQDGTSKLATRIGIQDRKYFNSGVLLLNLKKIRQDKITEKLVNYRRDQKNYFMDQDALNAILGAKRISLPANYNFRTAVFDIMDIEEVSVRFFEKSYSDIESCLSDQSIIHMSDRLKPWKYNFPWITEFFMYYYRKSPYKNIDIHFLSPLKALNDRYTREKERLQIQSKRKVWKFPFEKVKKGSDIILYGAGKAGQDLYRQLIESEFCQVILWVDRDYLNKKNNISSPSEIINYQYDYVVIAITDKIGAEEVKVALVDQGVKLKKIVGI